MSEIDEQPHCWHHTHDWQDRDGACATGDCSDDDDCVCCECCCTCLACVYAPRDGMLLFDPTAAEPFTSAAGTGATG